MHRVIHSEEKSEPAYLFHKKNCRYLCSEAEHDDKSDFVLALFDFVKKQNKTKTT